MILAPCLVAPWCNAADWRARAAARTAGECPAVEGAPLFWVWAGLGRAAAARCAP